MTYTLMTPIFLVITFLTVFSSVRKGYKLGGFRSAIHLAILVASAFLGAGLAILLSAVLEEPIRDLLAAYELTSMLEEAIGSFAEVALVLIGMVVTLVLFLPCFSVIRLILSLVMRLILSSRRKLSAAEEDYKSEEDLLSLKHSKRIGGWIGLAAGIFLTILSLSPITGLIKTSDNLLGLVSEFLDPETQTMPAEVLEISEWSDDFMVTAVDVCGGGMWFNMATTAPCAGEWTSFNREVSILRELGVNDFFKTMEQVGQLDDESSAALGELLGKMSESPTARLMLSIAVRDMSEAWLLRTDYMELERPDLGAAYIDRFFDELLTVLSKTQPRYVGKDLGTVLSLASILRSHESALADGGYTNAADIFAEGNLVDELKKELRKNPRMTKIVPIVDDIVISAVADEIGDLSRFPMEDRDALYEMIADILSSSATVRGDKRVDSVATDIFVALENYGVYAPEGLTEKVAELLIDNLSANGALVSPEDVSAYFEMYQSMGQLPILPEN